MAPDQSSGLLRQSESNGPTHEQKLGGVFQSRPVDKDLGILVHENLVMNNQCALAAQKFSCILGCIQSHVCSTWNIYQYSHTGHAWACLALTA